MFGCKLNYYKFLSTAKFKKETKYQRHEMEAIQLELLQLFFGVFSEHCNLAHSNAEHSHVYPQISTLTESSL